MNNQAYNWLMDWVDEDCGYFLADHYAGVVYLGLATDSLKSEDYTKFRKSMCQLLEDAAHGRREREKMWRDLGESNNE